MAKAAPNYIPLAQQANYFAVGVSGRGFPAGPYREEYGMDLEEFPIHVAENAVVAEATPEATTEEVAASEALAEPEPLAEPEALPEPESLAEPEASATVKVPENPVKVSVEPQQTTPKVKELPSELADPDQSVAEQLETLETGEEIEAAPEPENVHDTPSEQPETSTEITPPAEEAVLCYLALDFGRELVLSEVVRVDVDGQMVALLGAGERSVGRFLEGTRTVSFSLPKASKKTRAKGSIEVELRPFVYTKIVLEDISTKKRKRIIVRVHEDGTEVAKRSIDL